MHTINAIDVTSENIYRNRWPEIDGSYSICSSEETFTTMFTKDIVTLSTGLILGKNCADSVFLRIISYMDSGLKILQEVIAIDEYKEVKIRCNFLSSGEVVRKGSVIAGAIISVKANAKMKWIGE